MDTVNRGLDLEKELTCSICTEVLYEPLTLLDCLHTFCGACLKEWFSWQLAGARKNPTSVAPGSTPYTCPSCRAFVRETKRQATVVTLLDMFLAANPDKARSPEEKEDLKKKYQVGEDVMPKVDEREMTLRERMVQQADNRLMNEVRDLSLVEAGVESSEARRARRRREDGRLHITAPPRSRENSQETRDSEGRDRRRRTETESDGERQRHRDRDNSATLRPDVPSTQERRRRRSQEDARRRHEETSRTAARNLEHQSSLRSLISSSDVDSHEMEEEILRQIQEEGLLDGIDLENIDLRQEDQISERIAEAFRRRQRERSRTEPAGRSDAGIAHRTRHSSRSVSTDRQRNDEQRTSSSHRTQSRSSSVTRQADESARTAMHRTSTHLEVQPSEERRHRRRTTSGGRSSTSPVPARSPEGSRPSVRSQTDLGSDRSRSSQMASTRPQVATQGRSTTDPILSQPTNPTPPEFLATQSPSQMQSPFQIPSDQTQIQSQATTIPVELPSPQAVAQTMVSSLPERAAPPAELPASSLNTRAALPGPIFVPASASSATSLLSTSNPQPLQSSQQQSLVPDPLSPRSPRSPRHSHSPSTSTASERAVALNSATRPTSSGSLGARTHLPRYPEPSITCSRCAKPHIEYELHFECNKCYNGNWNICLNCYRSGLGCLYWFGFGNASRTKWDKQISNGELPSNAERPHMLTASRYIPPKVLPGGADGRRTITSENPENRLQSGAFCAKCLAWANECYWRCDICNENDWGFCNTCVNQGKCCTHSLLPLVYKPQMADTPPMSPIHGQQTPSSATVLTGPGVIELGSFKPLTFRVSCDICRYPIQPSSTRYHCFSCTSSKSPGRIHGDYDICTNCYNTLETKKRISPENGHNGWRRCLQGHRMIVVGFDDSRGGQHRIIVNDLVGGRTLYEEPSKSLDHSGLDLQQWSWLDGTQVRLVTTDVAATAPTTSTGSSLTTTFPPDGGAGMRAAAWWSWYPKEGEGENELMFPRGAEVREVIDVNGDWFHGVYMGAKGLFPAPFVRILDPGGM